MPAQSRLGDQSKVPSDAHGCPACPHTAVGPAIVGSPDVFVNGRPALRVDDKGVHAACCGPNQWTAVAGSATVFLNGKAAHRLDDADQHCGGVGQMIEGSPNVFTGDGGGGGGAGAPSAGQGAAGSPSPDGAGSGGLGQGKAAGLSKSAGVGDSIGGAGGASAFGAKTAAGTGFGGKVKDGAGWLAGAGAMKGADLALKKLGVSDAMRKRIGDTLGPVFKQLGKDLMAGRKPSLKVLGGAALGGAVAAATNAAFAGVDAEVADMTGPNKVLAQAGVGQLKNAVSTFVGFGVFEMTGLKSENAPSFGAALGHGALGSLNGVLGNTIAVQALPYTAPLVAKVVEWVPVLGKLGSPEKLAHKLVSAPAKKLLDTVTHKSKLLE